MESTRLKRWLFVLSCPRRTLYKRAYEDYQRCVWEEVGWGGDGGEFSVLNPILPQKLYACFQTVTVRYC